MQWSYKTDVGTFWIKPTKNNKFILSIDDDPLGTYPKPERAADEVATCNSGHWPWDKKLTIYHPETLHDWEKMP